ncbi:Uncharacterised protein [Mycobacterium tuberculosis]|uniref:Uncharacterized protein n=1 Tax=Mycobacterium tuberculosis TaxID=1773 RepID=A0A655FCY8_MYCTX|nr:Uncharacterised protein [Mycobacterium tuberculosis]CFS01088.1 Uncharacterised protein [Mycobacterium tuberculosis]CKU25973.1 Uncharacterised protein [Mycobacterium tuberculosis]CNM52342.1 Uncharacterised protein [Mycobacterium tuberculosis]CNT86356.1 Uncharacterised protein [Mycobacterium tuberculosis]
MVGEDALPNQLFGQGTQRGADLLFATLVGVGEPLHNLGLDFVDALVALGFTADGQRGGQLVGGHRGHRVVHVFAVVREHREVDGRFARLSSGIGKLLLRGAQRGDKRLGRLQARGHHAFRRRLGTTFDELDDVFGGLGFDHHDGNITLDDPAGHDHVEHGALDLVDGGEADPGAVDERHPHTADGPGERQTAQLGGRRRRVDRQYVVEIARIQAENRHHDLDLVAQPVDKRRAQRAVDEPAGQDRVGGGSALATEERTGDAAGRIHALLDVDREGEEVEVFFGVLAGGGRRQQHVVVVEVGDHRAGGLQGQSAGLEADGPGAKAPVVDGGGRLEHAFVNFSGRHDVRAASLDY